MASSITARRPSHLALRLATLSVFGLALQSAVVAPSGTVRAAVGPPNRPVAAEPAAFDPNGVTISLTKLAGTWSQPVLLTHAGDSSGRLFIVEQTGKVRIIKFGTPLATPFLDLSSAIATGGEKGLLGLAFHPGFRTNGKVYVNLTLASGDTAINEYRVGSNRDRVDKTTGRRIMTIAQPYANHNGGHIAFGRDGYLYIGMGDGGGAGDPENRAQNLNSLLGKMLRIDVNRTSGTLQYAIPADNPYVGRAGFDHIWARGLRNPWRWSFDRLTGDLWIGDVGQGRYEEVTRSLRSGGGGRGADYGWRKLEGRHCYNPPSGCSSAGTTLPLVEYGHASTGDDNCSVTGGFVYRGTSYPALQGGYLFGDFCSGRIWTIAGDAAYPARPVLLADTSLRISSFGQDQAGRLYVLDHAGAIYKISATAK